MYYFVFCLGRDVVSRLVIGNYEVFCIVLEEVGYCWKNLVRELNFNRGRIEMIFEEEEDD